MKKLYYLLLPLLLMSCGTNKTPEEIAQMPKTDDSVAVETRSDADMQIASSFETLPKTGHGDDIFKRLPIPSISLPEGWKNKVQLVDRAKEMEKVTLNAIYWNEKTNEVQMRLQLRLTSPIDLAPLQDEDGQVTLQLTLLDDDDEPLKEQQRTAVNTRNADKWTCTISRSEATKFFEGEEGATLSLLFQGIDNMPYDFDGDPKVIFQSKKKSLRQCQRVHSIKMTIAAKEKKKEEAKAKKEEAKVKKNKDGKKDKDEVKKDNKSETKKVEKKKKTTKKK